MSPPASLHRLPAATARREATLALFALGALGALLGLGAVAQRAAARLGDHPALGPRWLAWEVLPRAGWLALGAGLGGLGVWLVFRPGGRRAAPFVLLPAAWAWLLAAGPIYGPLSPFLWARAFGGRPAAGAILGPYVLAAWGVVGVSLGAFLLGALYLSLRFGNRSDLHGSARFAGPRELRAAGLLPELPKGTIAAPAGIFLGLDEHRRPLYLPGATHALLCAPTRSGKGVGWVIPNLLAWPESALVLDLKQELWQLTAGYRFREMGHLPLLFDPTSLDPPIRFNPLLECRPGPTDVRDAQLIADILVDPNGDISQRGHWENTAHTLLTATILHVLYAEADKTIAGCIELLSDPASTPEATLLRMIETPHLASGPHPGIASMAKEIYDKHPEERSSVISTALGRLGVYRDPMLAGLLSASDLSILDLVTGAVPVSLYLGVPPSDLSRIRPVLRLVVNLILRRLCETLPGEGDPRRPLLAVLDEFPALGRLSFFQDALAYLAGYRVRSLLITQDLGQLQRHYGEKESLSSNAAARIFLTPNDLATATTLSSMVGDATVRHQRSTVQSSDRWGGGRRSVTPDEVRRRLLTPDEALRLPADQALLFHTGLPPALIRRLRYYEHPELVRRSRLPPPSRDEVRALLPPPRNPWAGYAVPRSGRRSRGKNYPGDN